MPAQSQIRVRDDSRDSRRSRLWVLVICCMSVLLVSLDVTIVNVALPSIQRGLHSSLDGLQWVIDAYTLVMAALLMAAGSTADRLGRRRIFVLGIIVFTLGSALCAAAPTLGFLIAARVIQAIGGAMLNPVAISIIRNTFHDPAERARAIGIWAGVIGISVALGPIIGGLLVDGPGWRFVFLVNLPVGVAAVLLALRFVPESRAARARRFDAVGQASVMLALVALVYGIIEGGRLEWTSGWVIGAFLVAALTAAALVLYERQRADPLLDVRFFRSIPFSAAAVMAACVFGGTAGSLFLSTLYLQSARGFTALHAGLFSLPTAVATLVLSPLAGRLAGRYGTRWLFVGAGAARVLSALLLLRLSLHTSGLVLIIAFALQGSGMGLANAPISVTALLGMPPEQAGVAGGITAAANQVGASLGVAIVGAALGARATGLAPAAYAHATHAGWAILAGIGALLLVLGFVSTSRWARRTAETAAELVAEAA